MFCAEHFILELIFAFGFYAFTPPLMLIFFVHFTLSYQSKLVILSIGFFTNAMIALFCDT